MPERGCHSGRIAGPNVALGLARYRGARLLSEPPGAPYSGLILDRVRCVRRVPGHQLGRHGQQTGRRGRVGADGFGKRCRGNGYSQILRLRLCPGVG